MEMDCVSKQITINLLAKDRVWNENQKLKLRIRIEEELKKATKQKDYTRRLLKDCKSWGGPAITPEELQRVLKGRDNQQQMLRTEMF